MVVVKALNIARCKQRGISESFAKKYESLTSVKDSTDTLWVGRTVPSAVTKLELALCSSDISSPGCLANNFRFFGTKAARFTTVSVCHAHRVSMHNKVGRVFHIPSIFVTTHSHRIEK